MSTAVNHSCLSTQQVYVAGCVGVCVCTRAHTQLCPTPCNLMDWSPPGSSVHGIFQARILEWVAISFSRESSWPMDQTHISCVSCIGRWSLYTWEASHVYCLSNITPFMIFMYSFYCLYYSTCLPEKCVFSCLQNNFHVLYFIWPKQLL